ncbi:MAG TPA: HD domain-containing phosphohydrolase [Gaiellaceae bacterium]|nr:HD domain-containing phosphohydrolase [Gaiellaceae bacterium]
MAPAGEAVVSVTEACMVTVEALSRALELHDYRRGAFAENGNHGARVTALALRLAERTAPELAADPRLAFGFRLHDIGMIGVSDSILRKQGPLTFEELHEVREHPLLGERIVAPIAYLSGVARQVIGAHHEKWDGSGYPRRLEEERIPLAARIFSLADAFDAMTTDQPYRGALPFDVALGEIDAKAGSHFDPTLAPVFLELVAAQAPARRRAAG